MYSSRKKKVLLRTNEKLRGHWQKKFQTPKVVNLDRNEKIKNKLMAVRIADVKIVA